MDYLGGTEGLAEISGPVRELIIISTKSTNCFTKLWGRNLTIADINNNDVMTPTQITMTDMILSMMGRCCGVACDQGGMRSWSILMKVKVRWDLDQFGSF